MLIEHEDIWGERKTARKYDLLVECPSADCDCPYYDWRFHKCAMMAQGEGDPREECDNIWEDEEDE